MLLKCSASFLTSILLASASAFAAPGVNTVLIEKAREIRTWNGGSARKFDFELSEKKARARLTERCTQLSDAGKITTSTTELLEFRSQEQPIVVVAGICRIPAEDSETQ
jgi:hypothetical protein